MQISPPPPPSSTYGPAHGAGAVATGSSNAETARDLYIGPATVKSHVSSVLSKLGLRDRGLPRA